jgi:hypothetical protein
MKIEGDLFIEEIYSNYLTHMQPIERAEAAFLYPKFHPKFIIYLQAILENFNKNDKDEKASALSFKH